MRRFKKLPVVLAAVFGLAAPSVSLAWNSVGHRVISSIAYHRLDPQTRQKVADVLKKHPAFAELWATHTGNGPDTTLNLFWNASLFPDEARRGPFEKYSRPAAHYVNFRIMTELGNKVEEPLPGENVLNSYVAHVRRVAELKTPIEEKALHLSWIFHQAGDIHQPLHAVARFSQALPQGDRGGNGVTFPNPRARGDRASNLHAYWDNLLGWNEDPATIDRLAAEIAAEHPRERYADVLAHTNIRDWALESAQLSTSIVYNNLDPSITNFVDLPIGYEADAMKAARARIALAGYRLADELTRLFGEQNAKPNP